MSRILPNPLYLLFLSVTLSACVPSIAQSLPTSDTKHIIILGFDGWGSESFENADMPFLKSKLSESAWTLRKRSILPSSSACNWATMFKGAGPEAHGFIDWDTKSPAFQVTETDEKGNFPSLFSIIKKNHPESEMAYMYQWSGMNSLFDMDDFDYSQQFPTTLSGCYQMRDAAVIYILSKRPSLVAMFWDYPDKTGHTSGWYSDDYMTELKRIDLIIEAIIQACTEAGIIENTLFVITSDHGGHDKTHGKPIIEDLETPLIIWGPGIKSGEIKEPLMQYDVASILADYLHLQHPSSWRGKTPGGLLGANY